MKHVLLQEIQRSDNIEKWLENNNILHLEWRLVL